MQTTHTEEWNKQPDTWRCPGCRRLKPDCELTKADGTKQGWLVWHHDHMADYPKAFIKATFGGHAKYCESSTLRSEALAFKDKVELFAKRFRDELICINCNEIEGVIKNRIKADRFFSFHVHEIRRAFIPRPNLKHEIVEEHMPYYAKLYAALKDRLVDARKRQLELLIREAHHEGTFWASWVNPNRYFTEEELIVTYPEHDSGARIAAALARGEAALQYSAWPAEHDKRLSDMYQAGQPVDAIARQLGRTCFAIECRVEKLGLER